jgi:hypothetical protein
MSVGPEFFWIAVAVVTVLSSSRLTRIAVVDDFPPVRFFRDKLYDRLEGSGWQAITWCGYCVSFWITAAVIAWGYFTNWQDAWWLVNGAFAASYLAATYVTHDGDDD